MYRVCYEVATGRIIEVESGGLVEKRAIEKEEKEEDYLIYLDECDALESFRLQTMIDNAIRSGWDHAAITCVFMTDTSYKIAQANDPYYQAEVQAATQAVQVAQEAKVGMKALPGWTTWTVQESDTWFHSQITGITTLAQAKAFLDLVLPNMAKAIIYLRDHSQITR